MIYLDNAATTRIDKRVLQAMLPYLKNSYGNPGGMYPLGTDALHAVNKARKQVASLFHCEPENVIFTSGGSEGNNTVIREYRINKPREKQSNPVGQGKVLTSEIEHESVLKAANAVNRGERHVVLTGNDGSYYYLNTRPIDMNGVGLISIMAINNETGVTQFNESKLQEIQEYRKHGVLFHTDCVQAAGNFYMDVNEIQCDFATISGHKIYGPKGIGALYVRDLKTLNPLIYGGGEQEFGLRGGTENVASIVGFGKACELAVQELDKNQKHMRELKTVFMSAMRKQLKDYEWRINGRPDVNSKVFNICIPGFDAQNLVLLLGNRGVCVSAGSACTSHETKPSHVLKAMGLSDADAASSLRFSFSKYTTDKEVEKAVKHLKECLKFCESTMRIGVCFYGNS